MAATLPPSLSEAQPISWRAPECPFLIECAAGVLEEIRLAAGDAFFSLPHGGAEIGGVLFGTRQSGCVRILASRPLACEHAFGPTFTLSENDHARLRALLEAGMQDLRRRGMEPLGWYHSHTRSELALSAKDLEIHDRYFPEPWHVALVVRPHALQPMRAGFFFREADGSLHAESSYQEFVLQAEAQAAAPSRVPAPPVDEPPPVAAPRPLTEPRTRTERRPSGGVFRWATLALALALAMVAGFLAMKYHGTPALRRGQPPSVSLIAFDLEGQLQIRWDRAAEAVRTASGGTLEITDGASKADVPLDAQRLRGGTFSYARQTVRVDVRLALELPDGKKFEEFTTFLGAPVVPAADPATLRRDLQNQAVRTRQLERAVADLRSELRRRGQKP